MLVSVMYAPLQTSGEAEYVFDIADQPGQLHAALVLSTVGNATIQHIDSSEALVSNTLCVVRVSCCLYLLTGAGPGFLNRRGRTTDFTLSGGGGGCGTM
jgi:hypothetical protein